MLERAIKQCHAQSMSTKIVSWEYGASGQHVAILAVQDLNYKHVLSNQPRSARDLVKPHIEPEAASEIHKKTAR